LSGYATDQILGAEMGRKQKRAIKNHRARLGARDPARFALRGQDAVRDLIRSGKQDGILAALPNSPLVATALPSARPICGAVSA
jgi:hypothetical protein